MSARAARRPGRPRMRSRAARAITAPMATTVVRLEHAYSGGILLTKVPQEIVFVAASSKSAIRRLCKKLGLTPCTFTPFSGTVTWSR